MLGVVMLLIAAYGPLAPAHEVFVDDEARFLLSTSERERFLALDSDAHRQEFIDAFWRRHDRAAQLDRRELAARWFGASQKASARSRVLRQLGPPSFRSDLARSGHRLVPIELWHYVDADVPFLPRAFYLIFFRPAGAGRFRVWDPDVDGLRALVPTREPGRFLVHEDPRELKAADPELAAAARELVPGGGPSGSRSLLASLDAFAEIAERDRMFRGRVSTVVGARALDAQWVSTVWPDDAGVSELHYAVGLPPGEVDELAWRAVEQGRHRAPIRLIGRILTAAGIRDTWDDELWLDVSAGEKTDLATVSLSIQGRKLVTPDDARVEIAVWSGDASAFLEAPVRAEAIVASGSLPAEPLSAGPFQLGDVQWVPLARRPVRAGPVTVLAFPGREDGAEVSWEVWRGAGRAAVERLPKSRVAALAMTAEAGETYRIDRRQNGQSREVVTFTVSEAPGARIRVLARSRSVEETRRYHVARALSLIDRGDGKEAFAELPLDDAGAHVAVARRLYALERYRVLLTLLGARAESRALSSEADVFVLLGASASALGNFEAAVAHFERAVTIAPDNGGIRRALERARARAPR